MAHCLSVYDSRRQRLRRNGEGEVNGRGGLVLDHIGLVVDHAGLVDHAGQSRMRLPATGSTLSTPCRYAERNIDDARCKCQQSPF
jgi:hypothetical protein